MNYRKLAIIGASLAIIAAAGLTFTSFHKSAPAHQVKGASTTAAAKNDQTQPDTTPVAEKDTAPSNTAASTSKPKKSSNKTPTKTPVSNATPVKPVEPTTPPPAPDPEASYSIVLREDLAYIQPYPPEMGIEQYIVPFDIIFDPGFVPGEFGVPDCTFLTAPVEDHNVLCNVSQKEEGRGYLGVQYSNDSAAGYYEVQIDYPIDDLVASVIAAFELQDVQPE